MDDDIRKILNDVGRKSKKEEAKKIKEMVDEMSKELEGTNVSDMLRYLTMNELNETIIRLNKVENKDVEKDFHHFSNDFHHLQNRALIIGIMVQLNKIEELIKGKEDENNE